MNNAVQAQAVEGVLQVLAQIAEIRDLFFRVAVVLPEVCDDLSVGGLGTAIVDQDRHQLLCPGILEVYRLSIHKELKIAEGLGEQPLVLPLQGRVPQVGELPRERLLPRRLQQVAAGMDRHCLITQALVRRHIDEVYKRVELNEVAAQIHAAELRCLGTQKGDVYLCFSGDTQRLQAAGAAQELRLGTQLFRKRRQLRKPLGSVVYCEYSHSSSPLLLTTRTCCFFRCSGVIFSAFSSPTSSMSPPFTAASRRGPALRSAITRAAKRS